MSQERIQHLRKVIDRADYTYYNTKAPIITDEQYDALKKELCKLAPGDPRNTRFGPPELPPTLQKVRHACFMGSLTKCDTPQELRDWYAGMLDRLDTNKANRNQLAVTLKADGGSMALYYKDGVLWKAVTRGGEDGIGEDITTNAIHMEGVPTQLPIPANVAVRGEVILNVERWQQIDPNKKSNPRNLGNGAMRRTDGAGADLLSFLAFDVEAMKYTFPDEIITEKDKLDFLAKSGFTIIEHEIVDTIDDALAWYDAVAQRRASLPFWIDGVVFKMNDMWLQRDAGVHDNRPRAQTVLKFEAEGTTTKLMNVVLSMGHTGAIIPTGKVEPVRLGGTTVSSVLLNNFQLIKDLDLAIGDTVKIIKAKDIIPQIVEVVERPADRKPIVEPTNCPMCGHKTGRRAVKKSTKDGGEEGALTECKNQDCPARADARLKTWITKLDIQGIGDEVLAGLIEAGVKTPADLYRTATDPVKMAFLPSLKMGNGKLGMKRARGIIDQIKAKQEMPINIFIGSLGVPHLGRRRAELIMKAIPGQFESIDDWLDTERLIRWADAASIPNIASEIAAGIEGFREEIDDLRQFITIKAAEEPPAPPAGGEVFAGRTFCFTGKIEKVDADGKRYTRERMQQLVRDNGGSVDDDVRAGVTDLVQADPNSTSSKSTKAKKLGVRLTSEADFFKALGM